jgi:hypothetical protein
MKKLKFNSNFHMIPMATSLVNLTNIDDSLLIRAVYLPNAVAFSFSAFCMFGAC